MDPAIWYVFAGCMLVVVALSSTLIERSPASPAMIYLAAGILAGPLGVGAVQLDLAADAHLIELIAEIAVLISVFVAGLKMATSIDDGRWILPLRLAFFALPVTVALLAAGAVIGLGYSLAMAILLAGIVAPTDPVLASAVHVSHERDRDKLRFSLTGAAGLNDGTAFPFVVLGLTLLASDLDGGSLWFSWIARDLLWSVCGGLALGALCGMGVGHLVLWLRTRYAEALGLDEFLALGLIALANGLAVLLSTYGFLAVFAAGLALRRIATPAAPRAQIRRAASSQIATDPATAPAVLASALLDLNTSLERLAEVVIVFLTGALLATVPLTMETFLIGALLLLVVRPASVALTLWRTDTTLMHRALIGWFGVRGVGSLYYLAYAGAHGAAEAEVRQLGSIVLGVIATSVIVHGISVTPLMRWYDAHWRTRARP